MRCENVKCDNNHDGSFGSGRFCSKGCANSRIKTDEVKQKTSNSMKKAYVDRRAKRPELKQDQIEAVLQKKKDTWIKKLFESDFDELGHEGIRRWVFIEQDHKCNSCGLDQWLDNPLVLELEHKDGNNQNNVRENLEGLCPNCHSLTDTWRGRNKRKLKKDFVTDEQVVRAFLETGNIRQCLITLDMAAKGANYGRVKRALTIWGIEY